MNETFTPRTVVLVAISSLLAGFVLVFGGGMLAMRRQGVVPVAGDDASVAASDAAAPAVTATDDDAGAGSAPTSELPAEDGGAPAPVTVGNVTISPSGISRCWDQASPAVIAAATCDRQAGIDQHFASKAAEIAACAHGHGRLAFIMDFRYSTQFVRAWGGPSSTVPNAGTVSLCVRRVTAPLPLANIPHAHDRYVLTVPIEW